MAQKSKGVECYPIAVFLCFIMTVGLLAFKYAAFHSIPLWLCWAPLVASLIPIVVLALILLIILVGGGLLLVGVILAQVIAGLMSKNDQ